MITQVPQVGIINPTPPEGWPEPWIAPFYDYYPEGALVVVLNTNTAGTSYEVVDERPGRSTTFPWFFPVESITLIGEL